MRDHDPFSGYVILLWCRQCGHMTTRPCAGTEPTAAVRRRARCSQCGGRNVGALRTFEPRLPGPGSLHLWELRLICASLRLAAQHARSQADAIQHRDAPAAARLRIEELACHRLAAAFDCEAEERRRAPVHVLPVD